MGGSDEFLEALRSGNQDAAAIFEARFRPRIEAIARRRGVPSADRPDVVQDVLLDALRQIAAGTFRQDASLSTWLHILVNGWVSSYFRKRGSRQIISLEQLTIDSPSLV